MLVLSRQLDESIMIGDDIIITLVDIQGGKVRIGIAAPNDVPIHRQEVYELLQRENMEAAYVAASSEKKPAEPQTSVKPFDPKTLRGKRPT